VLITLVALAVERRDAADGLDEAETEAPGGDPFTGASDDA